MNDKKHIRGGIWERLFTGAIHGIAPTIFATTTIFGEPALSGTWPSVVAYFVTLTLFLAFIYTPILWTATGKVGANIFAYMIALISSTFIVLATFSVLSIFNFIDPSIIEAYVAKAVFSLIFITLSSWLMKITT